MNILAIETSTKFGSIAIRKGNVEKTLRGNHDQSRSVDLLTSIKSLLFSLNLVVSQLDLIAVSTGPGSLTGLRVGISVARGLALAHQINCIGVGILESLAFSTLNYLDGLDREVTAIVSPVRNNWCLQKFLVGQDKFESVSEINLYGSNEIIDLISYNSNNLYAADSETIRTLLLPYLGNDRNNLINCGDNLSSWISILASNNSLQNRVDSQVRPYYCF